MAPQTLARQILASKLHPPRLAARHVARPRLIDRLHLNRDRPITLVCAPAGAGKSALLSEWLAGETMPSAWISLDAGDRDPMIFMSYLLAAIEERFPSITFKTHDLLRALNPPPLATLAETFNNDLAQITTDFLLVLDDYHLVSHPQIDQTLIELLRHPPPCLHLVIATRADPAFPLPALRARGQISELRFADLQFTADESAALLHKALGDAVDQDRVTALHVESEGWAAGLQLMTLIAARNKDWTPRSSASGVDVGSYLLAEVFLQQDPLVQDRLSQASILDRFCASLLEAVCDPAQRPDRTERWGVEFLNQIEQANLFIVALDERHEFFRFHHLFQRFLRERLDERGASDQVATLHRRASAWFADQGLIEEALEHALAGGNIVGAADLAARHRHDLYDREQFARLTRWLRLLPIEVKERNAELLLAEARIATINWRFSEALVFLTHAESELAQTILEPDRARKAAGELAVLHGVLDLWSGQAERLLAELQRALAFLPTGSSHLRGVAHMGIFAAYWQLGDPDRAKSYLDRQLAETAPHHAMYATLLQTQAFSHWLEGNLTELELTARRLLAVSRELDLPDQAALANYFLGLAYFARNELTAAEEALSKAVAARFNLRLLWWLQAAGTLALCYQATGRAAQARATLADARELLLERHAVRILPNWGAFQAEVDRLQGRLQDAVRWASQVEPEPLAWTLAAVDPRIAQARAFLAQNRPVGAERAAELIADLRGFCARVPNRRLLLETEALAIVLHNRRGEREAARAGLERLVLAAEETGWTRLFIDPGELLDQLLTPIAPPGILSKVVAPPDTMSMPNGGTAIDQQPDLVEPLSERELEILALLGERESNKEIAARLFIAPSTVKSHTLNIYRKLEVNDRRAAVARAIDLGLVARR